MNTISCGMAVIGGATCFKPSESRLGQELSILVYVYNFTHFSVGV